MSEFVFVPLFVAAVVVAVLAVYNNIVVTRRFKLNTEKLDGTLRIVLLSDFHNKWYSNNCETLLARIRKEKPDIIVVAGDTVDRRRPNFERSRIFLQGVRGIADTYLVGGNHERALDTAECVKKLECDDIFIDDEYKIYTRFSILGLSDTVGLGDCEHQRDLVGIFEKLDNFKIVAVHRPSQFDKHLKLKDCDIDLVLCGHTHGGAVRIPFFGAVFSPDEGFFPKYTKGVYRENGSTLVVCAGLGNTLLPLRVNNFPEIVVIDVNGTKK